MLYRPNFCCHCGEKISRAKWTPLTSRRFCDFCAVEQKQHDLLPRAAALVALLVGAAGLTTYFGSGTAPPRPSSAAVATEPRRIAPEKPTSKPTSETGSGNSSSAISEVASVSTANDNAPKSKQLGPTANSSTDQVYHCGSMTKKGTPCTRRVKSPGRCWQHLGQPGMSSRE